MVKNKPDLSIVMPVFNAGRYIAQTIKSLLDQSYQDFELIIVNDGSEDNSEEVIRTFKDTRIMLINNLGNQGIVYSRNRGLSEARGKYIAPFDADDIARKDKFEKQIVFLEKHRDFGMIGSWAKLIDESGRLLKEQWKLAASPGAIPSILLFRNYFAQPAVLIRRECVPDRGYKDGYDIGEDYIMWADIAKKSKVWNLPEYLVHIRKHQESTSRKDEQLLQHYEKKIYKNLFRTLEIEPDDQQFATLLQLKSDKRIERPEVLNAIENFLMLVLNQNRKIKVYEHRYLVATVYNRWLKACYKAGYHKPQVVRKFFSSPLQSELIKSKLPW